jgi:hypothetical protein
MRYALPGIPDLGDLAGNPVIGMRGEGFVIANLISVLSWRSHACFHRTQAGAGIALPIERGDGSLWAVEIKRNVAPRLDLGFHAAREDLKPARSFVVHGGDDRFPLAQDIEAIGLVELAGERAAPG